MGAYCPLGSIAEIPCPAGTYNLNEYQKECKPCPAGYYCLLGDLSSADKATRLTANAPKLCKAGHKCPGSTSNENGDPCDTGTYQPETGRTKCLACPPGYACETTGMDAVTNTEFCSAGYYCKGGSKTKTPVGVDSGDICKAGTYCEEGSAMETPCPPGLACPSQAMSLADAKAKLCAAGYYCSGGAASQ